jgi:hypothetical protein
LTNVTFTVRDSSSNASVCVSSVTVADTTPPFVLACVLELTLGFDANCQALLPDLTSTNYIIASDNCSSVRVAQSPPALTAIPVGTNTVVLTVSDSASNQTTRAVTVIVPGKPSIALAPADLTVVAGSNASFSVLACGAAPLLYQWQHMSTNLPSATNAVLALANVQDAAAGSYTVLIANVAGNVTTAPAGHHPATCQSSGDAGLQRFLPGFRHRDWASELPVAQGWRRLGCADQHEPCPDERPGFRLRQLRLGCH